MIDAAESALRSLPRVKGTGLCEYVSLNDQQWEYTEYSWERKLSRDIPSGSATIKEWRPPATGQLAFRLEIRKQLFHPSSISWAVTFPTLEDAATAAERFSWTTREYAGRTWYNTCDDDELEAWEVHFAPGHSATVKRYKKDMLGSRSGFSVEHFFSPHPGEIYEIKALRYGDASPIATFGEAAAVACTLPAYVGNLMHVDAPAAPATDNVAHPPAQA